ncbi:MAG: discoidin domain-containing protein [Myxococcota bacterium]
MTTRITKWKRELCGAATLLLLGTVARADKSVPGVFSYVIATSSENGEAPSTWPFNALDGKPTTGWCTAGDAVGQSLVLGFMKPETITHVGGVPGVVVGTLLDGGHARVRELELNDGKERRTVVFIDDAKLQEVMLQPPMTVRELTITIKDVFPSEKAGAGACLGELSLRKGDMPLTGEAVARQVRGITRPKLRLVGPWVDNPSAPERFLTLALDGTFTWRFEPLMEGSPTTLSGTWDVANGRLQLKPRAGKPSALKYTHDKVQERGGTFQQLVLEGEAGHEKLPGSYRPAVLLNP